MISDIVTIFHGFLILRIVTIRLRPLKLRGLRAVGAPGYWRCGSEARRIDHRFASLKHDRGERWRVLFRPGSWRCAERRQTGRVESAPRGAKFSPSRRRKRSPTGAMEGF